MPGSSSRKEIIMTCQLPSSLSPWTGGPATKDPLVVSTQAAALDATSEFRGRKIDSLSWPHCEVGRQTLSHIGVAKLSDLLVTVLVHKRALTSVFRDQEG
jgi:hypothetical protein